MIPSDDVLTGLPAPFEDEPPSVRRDIADELADHLACAYRREQLKTADELTAQQRVLDHFGDPRRIAYQLWFQALWGRIMLHRFTRVVQGLKIVGGIVALLLAYRMVEQQAALHSQMALMSASYNSMQSQAMVTQNRLDQLLQHQSSPPQQPDSESGNGLVAGQTSTPLPDKVLLNFTASWCGPCQQMNPIINNLARQGYSVRHVDVDRERALAQRFNITAMPTFVRLDKGREVMRQTGATSEAQLVRLAK